MTNNFSGAKKIIDDAQSILLTTHERTDGDDLGTVLAFAAALKKQGKTVSVVILGGVPKQLRFLPGSELVSELLPTENFDLLFVSGCGHRGRIGHEQIIGLRIPTLNFDHHPDNTNFGTVNVVDAGKAAVAELAYDFFRYAGWPITQAEATCLLTGMFTDTGSFMHSNTTPHVLSAAADLLRRGAHVARVAKNTYKGKNPDTLRAWSRAFTNTNFNERNTLIYSVINEDDLRELHSPHPSVFEGFVETINQVPEASFALFLKQDGEEIKGSLRSDPHKNINVADIAHTLGGGGHKWAAGFSFPGKLIRENQAWSILGSPETETVMEILSVLTSLPKRLEAAA